MILKRKSYVMPSSCRHELVKSTPTSSQHLTACLLHQAAQPMTWQLTTKHLGYQPTSTRTYDTNHPTTADRQEYVTAHT